MHFHSKLRVRDWDKFTLIYDEIAIERHTLLLPTSDQCKHKANPDIDLLRVFCAKNILSSGQQSACKILCQKTYTEIFLMRPYT